MFERRARKVNASTAHIWDAGNLLAISDWLIAIRKKISVTNDETRDLGFMLYDINFENQMTQLPVLSVYGGSREYRSQEVEVRG